MKEFYYTDIDPNTLEEKSAALYMTEEFYLLFYELRNKEYGKFYNMLSKMVNSNPQYLCTSLQRGKAGHLKFNYIDITAKDNGLISFLPGDKKQSFHSMSGKFLKEGRQTIKPGRFINQFFHPALLQFYKINDKDLEALTSIIKGKMSTDDWEIKIVNGEEIRSAYYEQNYLNNSDAEVRGGNASSSIHGSCMRYNKCQPWFNLYVEEEKIKMVVMVHKPTGKIAARALLWDNVQFYDRHKLTNAPEEFKFMDRIYAYREWQIEFLSDWAIENGYVQKRQQKADNKTEIVRTNGTTASGTMVATISKIQEFYPYTDTFTYMTGDKLKLVNESRYPGKKYELTAYQNGNVQVNSRENSQDCECYHCNNNFSESQISTVNDEIVCDVCRDEHYRWVPSEQEYIYEEDTEYDMIADEYIRSDDAYVCLDHRNNEIWTIQENICHVNGVGYQVGHPDIVTLHDESSALLDECGVCAVDGEYYLIDDLIFVEAGRDEDVAGVNIDSYMLEHNLVYNDDREIVVRDESETTTDSVTAVTITPTPDPIPDLHGFPF